MNSTHLFIKRTLPILTLLLAWSYTMKEDSMHYPEDMSLYSNNPHSPDYSPEYGQCYACDSELVLSGDRLEPDLICPNQDCENSPNYIDEEE